MRPNEFEKEKIYQAIDKLLDANVKLLHNQEISPLGWYAKYGDEIRLPHMYRHGLTKSVIIMEDLNWVIKFSHYDTDLCQTEADIYAMACGRGVGEYLAETYFFAERDEMRFYIQERCECDHYHIEDIFCQFAESHEYLDRDSFKSQDEYDSALRSCAEDLCDTEALEAVFDYNQRLFHFLFDENNLCDFHSGNFGIRKNGSYVLVDFSGC